MKSSVQNRFSVHQWVSCGFRLVDRNCDTSYNQKRWGTLYSPKGAGGNFLMTGTVQLANNKWPSADVTNSLVGPMKRALKVWDHRFLNDLEFDDSVLTLEVLGRGLWKHVCNVSLDHGAVWQSVKVDMGEKICLKVSSKGNVSCEIGFRMQSLIKRSGLGVDVDISLVFDGHDFYLGEVQGWISTDLCWHLQEQPIDDWLGVTTVDEIPEKLFPLVKQKFPAVLTVALNEKGREIIATSA